MTPITRRDHARPTIDATTPHGPLTIRLPTVSDPVWRTPDGTAITYGELEQLQLDRPLETLAADVLGELVRAAVRQRHEAGTGGCRALVGGLSLLIGELSGTVGPHSRTPAP